MGESFEFRVSGFKFMQLPTFGIAIWVFEPTTVYSFQMASVPAVLRSSFSELLAVLRLNIVLRLFLLI